MKVKRNYIFEFTEEEFEDLMEDITNIPEIVDLNYVTAKLLKIYEHKDEDKIKRIIQSGIKRN